MGDSHKMTQTNCAGCGKSIMVRSYRMKEGKPHYCGRNCMGKAGHQAMLKTLGIPSLKGRQSPNWRGGRSKDWVLRAKLECERHPDRIRARRRARNARVSGRLIRQACEVCGATENVHAHHDDYRHPLQVRWLCRMHHNEYHQTGNSDLGGESLGA